MASEEDNHLPIGTRIICLTCGFQWDDDKQDDAYCYMCDEPSSTPCKGWLLTKCVDDDSVYEESAKCFIKQRPFKKGERARLIASFHRHVEHDDICGCTPEGYTLHDVLQAAEEGDR